MKINLFANTYVAPVVEEVELNLTGILCTSPSADTEPLGEDRY